MGGTKPRTAEGGHGVHPDAEKQEEQGDEKVEHRQKRVSHKHIGPPCGEKPDRGDDTEQTEGGQFPFVPLFP